MATPVALITGASSGIGHALALEYAKCGHRVAILARRTDRLTTLAEQVAAAGGEALPLACDVSVDGEVDRAARLTVERFGRIDVAIANAGISTEGALADLTLADFRRVFETNVFGVLRTAYATLEALTASRGAFAAIGSVAGYLPTPRVAAYNASKYAVRALAETLRHEWRPRGISVTHVAPGFVESEARLLSRDGTIRDTARDPVPPWLVMSREEAARQIARAVAARRREVVLTRHGKAAVFLARHAPGLVARVLDLAASRANGSWNAR